MNRGVPIILDGPAGSGKTSFLLNVLKSYYNSGSPDTSWLHLYMDRETSSARLWGQLKERIKWHSGTSYIPAGCQYLICFIDDLHLTQVSTLDNELYK